MQKITVNLIVDSIEDALPFWVDRLGFHKTVEVPQGGRLAFVILDAEGVELMLQTRASLEEDVPDIAAAQYRSVLYIRVSALDPIREALEGWPCAVPERTTDYGARELIVRDPSENVVFFAERTTP